MIPIILNRRGTGGGPVSSTFTNGYSYQFEIAIGKEFVRSSEADFEFLFVRTLAELKTTGNGGLVQHASGWDIRFELADGTKLPHATLKYTASTGFYAAVVKIPVLTAGAYNRIYMYCGKTVTATEADRTNTFTNVAAFYYLPTAGDFTNNNSLTSTGTTTTTTDVAWGQAAVMSGDDFWTRASFTALNGLSQYSVFAQVKPSTTGVNYGIVSVGGTPTGVESGESSYPLSLRMDATGDTSLAGGVTRNNLFSGVADYSDGRLRYETKAGIQSTSWTMVCLSKGAGERHRVGVNGTFTDVQGYVSSASGVSTAVISNTLRIGQGPAEAAAAGFNGQMGIVMIRKLATTEDRFFAYYWSYMRPDLFFSVSDARATSGNRAPVVAPYWATTYPGTAITYTNIIGGGFDPDGNTLSVTALGTPLRGTASRSGNVITYTPDTSSASVDYFSVTVSDGAGKTNITQFTVNVFPSVNGTPQYWFMDGWENDPDNVGRKRHPGSQRQWNPGSFVGGSEDYNTRFGYLPPYYGYNSVMYQSSTLVVNTWQRLAGGERDNNFAAPTVSTYMPNLKHQNNGEFRNASNRASMWLGNYCATLPRGASNADAQAAAEGNSTIIDWWKHFAKRMRASANVLNSEFGWDYRKLILRPNWEGMNQDTGLKLANGNWYEAGFTQRQYNSMMRYWISTVWENYGWPIYIAFSPAFETTKGTSDKTYQSYMSDPVDGWVGYSMCCASVHPTVQRCPDDATARKIVTGTGLTEGARFWVNLAISNAKTNGLVYGGLEHGNWDNGNINAHGNIRYFTSAYEAYGQALNDPTNYGYISFSGLQGFRTTNYNWNPPCEYNHVSGATFTNCVAHAPLSTTGIWDSNNTTYWGRSIDMEKKYFGKKSLYGNITAPI